MSFSFCLNKVEGGNDQFFEIFFSVLMGALQPVLVFCISDHKHTVPKNLQRLKRENAKRDKKSKNKNRPKNTK